MVQKLPEFSASPATAGKGIEELSKKGGPRLEIRRDDRRAALFERSEASFSLRHLTLKQHQGYVFATAEYKTCLTAPPPANAGIATRPSFGILF